MARDLSNRRRQWLTEQLTLWQAEGIISSDQNQAILDSYASQAEMGSRKRRLASFALVGLAVLMFGLAVQLLVGHNWRLVIAGWESLGQAVKVAIVFALLAGSYGGACYLRLCTSWQRWSEVAFLWACFMFGAGIWLIGQVFHVDAHWPDGIWWWAIGVLPVALCLDTLVVHCLLVGLLGFWVGAEVLNYPHLHGLWGALPNGAYSLLPITAIGLAWCYRRGSSWGVALYAGLIAWWIIAIGVVWGDFFGGHDPVGFYFIAATATLFLIAGELHRPGSSMARPWLVLGSLLTAGTLIPLGVGDFHRYGHWSNGELPEVGLGCVFAITMLAFFLALLPLWRGRTMADVRCGSLARFGDTLRRNWLPLGLCVSILSMCFLDILWGASCGYWNGISTIIGNATMLCFALWLMQIGLRDERGLAFAAGVLYLIVWAVVCYASLFGDVFGMLGAAGMFFVCGVVLLGLSIFWYRRKEQRNVE